MAPIDTFLCAKTQHNIKLLSSRNLQRCQHTPNMQTYICKGRMINHINHNFGCNELPSSIALELNPNKLVLKTEKGMNIKISCPNLNKNVQITSVYSILNLKSNCKIISKEFIINAHSKNISDRFSSSKLNYALELKCKLCQKKFRTPRDLKKHITTEHTKAQLNNHTETVHICKNCGICGKSLKDRRHKKEHVEGIEHFCETCSKGLGRKKHLLNHITTVHKKSGNFTCAFCGKKFVQLSMKKIHETKHTKKYNCIHCVVILGETTVRQNELHFESSSSTAATMVKVYEEKSQYCDSCSETFSKQSQLTTQIRSTHEKEKSPCNSSVFKEKTFGTSPHSIMSSM